MKAYVYTSPFGVFLFDENLEILDYKTFPKDAKLVAEKLMKAASELIEEEKELLEKIKEKDVYFVYKKEGYKIDLSKEDEIKNKVVEFLIQKGLFNNLQEILQFSSQVSKEISKLKLKETKKDKIIAHVIQAIEEHEKILNTLIERLREIYSLYFPEFEEKISDHKKFVNILSKNPKRENIEGFEEIAKESVGMEFDESDLKIIKNFAEEIKGMFSFKESLEKYLEKLMKEVAPNLSEIAGIKIGAKLIRAAGSLEKLAKLPSSTIQLLGAEKALFRFLRGKGKPPKHGYIFMHPLIQSAPKKLRGKIARALASKIMMAARIDNFSKEYKADKLKKDLEERIKEICESKK